MGRHGDLVFVSYKAQQDAPTPPQPTESSASQPPSIPNSNRPWESVKEDTIDEYWRSKDGKIPRGRDSRFCKHGANAMCDYCMPLEPYDAGYHTQNNIKHLSYHAFLKKLQPKSSASTSTVLPPLEPQSYKVKVPCPSGGHANWPGEFARRANRLRSHCRANLSVWSIISKSLQRTLLTGSCTHGVGLVYNVSVGW